MPIMDQNYISSLYYFTNSEDNKILILENFNETQSKKVEQKRLIQGDIGIYATEQGGTIWESSLSAPVFIINDGVQNSFMDILDLILKAYQDPNFQISPSSSSSTTIIEKATITINENGVKCDINASTDIESIKNWLQPQNVTSDITWSGRQARFYDTNLILGNWMSDDNVDYISIMNGKIEINVVLKKHYFIRSSDKSPYPDFMVQGYNITGTLQFAYPFQYEKILPLIVPYIQNTEGNMFILNVAGRTFDLSGANITLDSLQTSVSSKNITYVTIKFMSYAASSVSSISGISGV